MTDCGHASPHRGAAPRACGLALAAVLLSHPDAGRAIDVPPPGGASESRLALDMSLDMSSLRSGSLDANATLAPFGSIYDSGLRLRLSMGTSWYEYLAGDSPRILGNGRGREVNLLVGYGLALQRVSLIGAIGVSMSESVDQGRTQSAHGARAVLSIYARPGDRSMAYASLTHSTIQSTTQLQAKVGAKVPGNYFVGPEINVTWRGGDPWNTSATVARIGAHVSSVRVGNWYLSVSGGRLRDRDLGYGNYLGLGLYGGF